MNLTHLRYGKHLTKMKLCPVQKGLWVAYSCKTYKSYTSASKGKEYQSENQAIAVVMFLNFKLLRQRKNYSFSEYIDFMQFYYARLIKRSRVLARFRHSLINIRLSSADSWILKHYMTMPLMPHNRVCQ